MYFVITLENQLLLPSEQSRTFTYLVSYNNSDFFSLISISSMCNLRNWRRVPQHFWIIGKNWKSDSVCKLLVSTKQICVCEKKSEYVQRIYAKMHQLSQLKNPAKIHDKKKLRWQDFLQKNPRSWEKKSRSGHTDNIE